MWLRLTLAILVVDGMSWSPTTVAAADKKQRAKAIEPIVFPDGVLDPERKTAFVTSPKGGVQAIQLDSGKVLWTNDDCPAQPWLVAGTRLIARGEQLYILDLKNEGKLERKCDALPFPKVVVPDRCVVTFHTWNPRVVDGALEVKWYGVANVDRSKGRPFNFEGWTKFNKAVPVGSAKVNLDNGKVDFHTDANPGDVTGTLMPAAMKPESRMPPGLSKELTAVWQQYHKDQRGNIIVVGNHLIGVSMTLEKMGNEYSKRIDLNVWDIKSGKAAPPVELVKDTALNIANIALTEDGHHAAVQFGSSAVKVYSLSSGKQVGIEVKGVQSPERAFVDGNRLYFSQMTGSGVGQIPQVLKALDLDNGKVVWERDLKPRAVVRLTP
jgi:hypothetical protein